MTTLKDKQKILMLDKHAMFRDGLRCMLRHSGMECSLLEAGNWAETMNILDQHGDVAVLLAQLNLPGTQENTVIRLLRQRHPDAHIVALLESEHPKEISDAIQFGATNYICKTFSGEKALSILKPLLSGGSPIEQCPSLHLDIAVNSRTPESQPGVQRSLTRRQQEVLQCLSLGLSNKEISDKLTINIGTAKVHVAAVLQALRVNSRSEAVSVAYKMGLIQKDRFQSTQGDWSRFELHGNNGMDGWMRY